MSEIEDRIVRRAERKFDAGKDHFIARTVLSELALELMTPGKSSAIDDRRATTNDLILARLAARGAEAEIYAVVHATHDGYVHSNDAVRVLARDGVPTEARRSRSPWGHVTRGTTGTGVV
jgi:hypothetical protein